MQLLLFLCFFRQKNAVFFALKITKQLSSQNYNVFQKKKSTPKCRFMAFGEDSIFYQ